MSWNHRVMRHEKDGEEWLALHEVYSEPTGWTENEIAPIGQTKDELRWTLEQMLAALDKPILDYETGKEAEDRT